MSSGAFKYGPRRQQSPVPTDARARLKGPKSSLPEQPPPQQDKEKKSDKSGGPREIKQKKQRSASTDKEKASLLEWSSRNWSY